MCFGVSYGIIFDDLAVGIGVGLSLGAGVGLSLGTAFEKIKKSKSDNKKYDKDK